MKQVPVVRASFSIQSCSSCYSTLLCCVAGTTTLDREWLEPMYTLVATSADSVPSSNLVRITIAPIGTTFGNLQ